MDDRELRSIIQKWRWWYAASRDDGPAHIIEYGVERALCGVDHDSTAYVRATKLCGNCRRIALKRIAATP